MKATLGLFACAAVTFGAIADDAMFDAPVRLTDGDKNFADVIYPSPVLFDLDGDGSRELVLGDLPGNLWFCSHAAANEDTQWNAKQAIQADGKPLKLHNW